MIFKQQIKRIRGSSIQTTMKAKWDARIAIWENNVCFISEESQHNIFLNTFFCEAFIFVD
jgi:hypothetical protein